MWHRTRTSGVGLLLLALTLPAGAFSYQGPSQTTPPGQQPTPSVQPNEPKPAPTAAPLTKEQKETVLKELETIVTQQAFVPGIDLSKWPEFVEKQREAIDAAETDLELTRSINAALRDFGVSHIRFLAPRAAEARRRTSTIGVGLMARSSADGLVVTFVFPKGPAEAAGIKNGDLITAVDGKAPDSVAALQGEDGTEAALTVKAADGTSREFRVRRAPQSVRVPDSLKWVGDDAAVLRVGSFTRGYERAEVERMMVEASKAKYLVLDLRSNGGGAVNNLNHLLSLLMPPSLEIGTFISRRNAEKYSADHGGRVETDPVVLARATPLKFTTRRLPVSPFPGKIAVLVNRGSASASEICAAALRENLKSPVLGTRTAGAVLASVFRRLPMGYEIQYPISDYVTRDGVRLEKNPIVPDIEVSGRPSDEDDPAVARAIERLRTGS